MKIKDLFDIKYGVNLELSNCEITKDIGSVNFVARTSNNNGVVAKVKPIDGISPQPAGVLSCAGAGNVLATFVQYKPFYSGRDLYILTPKKEMPLIEKLYYCYVIRMNKYRYSYGRQANKTLKDIEVPDTIPDWVYNIDLNKYNRMIQTSVVKKHIPLNTHTWQSFKLSDLFTFKRGKRLTQEDRIAGNIPLVTAGEGNQGVKDFISNDSQEIHNHCITIDMFCNSYYHGYDFCCDDNIIALTPQETLSKYAMIFIATIISKDKYQYQYGRQYRIKNFQKHFIKLPATFTNTPDWVFMEEYITSLPYSDKI